MTSVLRVRLSPLEIRIPAVMLAVRLQQRITVVSANGRLSWGMPQVQAPRLICRQEWRSRRTTTVTRSLRGKA